jgi:hypothetical protein
MTLKRETLQKIASLCKAIVIKNQMEQMQT